jgi:hypothetical protein
MDQPIIQSTVCSGVFKQLCKLFTEAELPHIPYCVRCNAPRKSKTDLCRFKGEWNLFRFHFIYLYVGFRQFGLQAGTVTWSIPTVSWDCKGMPLLQSWNRLCDAATLQTFQVSLQSALSLSPASYATPRPVFYTSAVIIFVPNLPGNSYFLFARPILQVWSRSNQISTRVKHEWKSPCVYYTDEILADRSNMIECNAPIRRDPFMLSARAGRREKMECVGGISSTGGLRD